MAHDRTWHRYWTNVCQELCNQAHRKHSAAHGRDEGLAKPEKRLLNATQPKLLRFDTSGKAFLHNQDPNRTCLRATLVAKMDSLEHYQADDFDEIDKGAQRRVRAAVPIIEEWTRETLLPSFKNGLQHAAVEMRTLLNIAKRPAQQKCPHFQGGSA
jgi:hypothetical protein